MPWAVLARVLAMTALPVGALGASVCRSPEARRRSAKALLPTLPLREGRIFGRNTMRLPYAPAAADW